MLIVQLTDTHIVEKGKKTLGVAPMDLNLIACVDHINCLTPKPDVVLVTGDITNSGSRAEAEHACELLNKLECPYFVLPGNHDDRENLQAAFGARACPPGHDEFISYVIEGHDVRLIGLDSTTPGKPGGAMCARRTAWLKNRLDEAPDTPTLLFIHHPPLKLGVPETDRDGFQGADTFGDVVENNTNIERIICGHIHLSTHTRWHGTIVSTAPSTGMQIELDLTMEHDSKFVLEAPGYQLHHWTSQKNLVTHTVYVRENAGPYMFEEHNDT